MPVSISTRATNWLKTSNLLPSAPCAPKCWAIWAASARWWKSAKKPEDGSEEGVALEEEIPGDENLELAEEALNHLATFPQEQLERALANITRFKSRMAPPTTFSEAAFKNLDDQVWKLRVDTLGEKQAAEKSPEDGKRSPVEVY